MGRHDPERRQAIATALAEMQPNQHEEFVEFMAMTDAEEARMIADEYDFRHRVDAIYGQIDRLGITPRKWMSDQDETIENRMIYDALIERWELENTIDEEPDNWLDTDYMSTEAMYREIGFTI